MEKFGLFRRVCINLGLCMAAVIAPAQSFTTLYSFDGTDGQEPLGLIQGADGNFYGTTIYGGEYCKPSVSCGTVFKVTYGGVLTTLHSFCAQTACSDGAKPGILMQAKDGNLYGTTSYGGAGYGTVFQITPDGVLTTLHNFHKDDGAEPHGKLIQATDGNFYGTTYRGGTSSTCQLGCGTVFQITPAGVLTTLHSFDQDDGANPEGGLVQATDGNFYGTTSGGGTCNYQGGCGTVFRITSEGALTTLHSFQGGDGLVPNGGLIQATDGNFYGTTQYGGYPVGNGTIFSITPEAALNTIYTFCPQMQCFDGATPYTGVIQAVDGNLYGTTGFGGALDTCRRGCGTVFEITLKGTLGTLHTFRSTDGRNPTGLIQGTNGSIFGTTAQGGSSNNCENRCGAVYRLVAIPAAHLAPISWTFGMQAINEASATKTVTLRNSGTALLVVSGVAIGGSGFAISANACEGVVLGIGKTCTVDVISAPTILGKMTGKLTFTDNASNSPQTVGLSGLAVEPATLLPAGPFFYEWRLGTTSVPKTFTLTNNQNEALTSIAISTTGDFTVSATTCTTSLAAKSKCTISVTFTPTASGKRTGRLVVSDSASNSPQISNLTGTGK